jgi:very-short-patch-repair endonuclease
MLFYPKRELTEIAKQYCRDLRKRQTMTEGVLWSCVQGRKLNNRKFHRQYPIFYKYETGESFFVLDFYCSECKLGIELDGEIHKYHVRADEERTKWLNKKGITVVRFTNEEILRELPKVLDVLSELTKTSL